MIIGHGSKLSPRRRVRLFPDHASTDTGRDRFFWRQRTQFVTGIGCRGLIIVCVCQLLSYLALHVHPFGF